MDSQQIYYDSNTFIEILTSWCKWAVADAEIE